MLNCHFSSLNIALLFLKIMVNNTEKESIDLVCVCVCVTVCERSKKRKERLITTIRNEDCQER
uniref:Uncharacterized protein n=1 Tax=Anguilla anguilla TaxID=7936 RepID=A0A0E9WN71_ANGAN